MAKRPRKPRGFGEAQTPFGQGVDYGALFEGYGFACAFTGRDLRAEAASDPGSWVVRIGDNALDVGPQLVIPSCLDAIAAFERGHLAIGPRYNFLVDLERIAPEFLETLNPIGRLRLPSVEAFYPLQRALAAHLRSVALNLFPAG